MLQTKKEYRAKKKNQAWRKYMKIKVGANVAAFVFARELRGVIFQWQFEPCGVQIVLGAVPVWLYVLTLEPIEPILDCEVLN